MVRFYFYFALVLFLCSGYVSFAQRSSDTVLLRESTYKQPVIKREVTVRRHKSYVSDPDYAYANDSDYWKRPNPVKSGFNLNFLNGPFLRYLVFTLLIAMIGWGIYQVIRESNFGFLRRRPDQKEIADSQDAGEKETDFDAIIKKLQEEGNYRLAVRFLYLRLLRKVQQNNQFSFQSTMTNADLVRAFAAHPADPEFRYLARAYEYIFYGGFMPPKEMYAALKTKFESLQKKFSV